MAIMKEWRCAAHGEFESPTASCPHGCPERFIKREFRTAPGITSGRTKRADWAINALAEDYGYRDINNSPSRGESVAQWATKNRKVDKKPMWAEVPHAEPGFSRNKDIAVPVVNAQQYGTIPVTDVSQVIAGRKGRGIPTSKIHRAKDLD